MPAYVLFKLTPGVDPASEQQFQAGWPIAVRAQSQYGGKQVLPNFGQLVITDATVKQVEAAYMSPLSIVGAEDRIETVRWETRIVAVGAETRIEIVRP